MSLYIQITKRCNMSCNHCSFSCGERGPDMDAAIFRRVLELSEREETPITLGGGEPTLHPLFMDFLWRSIRAKAALTYELGMPAVGLVTNGSRTAVALELAALAKVGVICASVRRPVRHPGRRHIFVRLSPPEARTCRGHGASSSGGVEGHDLPKRTASL